MMTVSEQQELEHRLALIEARQQRIAEMQRERAAEITQLRAETDDLSKQLAVLELEVQRER